MKLFRKIIREIFRSKIKRKFINSSLFWEERYFYGGNSGRGSYAEDAKIKSKLLNDTILKYNLKYAIDIGCGDGNNLSLFEVCNYSGIDVSKSIIEENKKRFISNKSKKFYLLENNHLKIVDEINRSINKNDSIIVSFDVILHLVEDYNYKDHLDFINSIRASYCLVSSSDENIDYNPLIPHVKHRNYSKDFLSAGWELIIEKKIPNCPDKRDIKLFKRNLY